MPNWITQLFLGVTIVIGVGGYLVFDQSRIAPQHYVATITNTTNEQFRIQHLPVIPKQLPAQARQALRSSFRYDVRQRCDNGAAHTTEWKYAKKLSPGQSIDYEWDGLWKDCLPAPEGRYHLMAIDYGDSHKNWRNPKRLTATLRPKAK